MELRLLPAVLLLVDEGGGVLHHLGDLVRADADGALGKVDSLQVDLFTTLAQELEGLQDDLGLGQTLVR